MSTSPPLVVADRYRLVAPLGQGGMGRVWRATDVVLHREVAIKELVPPPGLTPDERREMRERSLREARAIARLNNINVVRVFDVLRTDADPWIVMEYVPSRSLQDVLASDGPVPPVRAAEIGIGMLNALRAAHRNGVVHRDVKPGNVLIGEDGRVVLTDFGLATVPGDPTVTRTGLVLGSPAYIAPERARDGTAGPAADLWSLGATLYAAVEGASPFARPTAIATLAALATENPPPARNAGPLKPVLNGLLRKDPTHRINAEEAERLLLRASGRRSRLALPMSPTMRRPSAGRQRPALSGTGPPPVVPGPTASGSAPVVPGPRPPVSTGRPPGTSLPPARPSGAPVSPSTGTPTGRPPVFIPGKASVARPADTPTRVDGPKVEPPRLDATRVDTPPVRDVEPAADKGKGISGTSGGARETTGQRGERATSTPASTSANGALARGTRGIYGTIPSAEAAADLARRSPEAAVTAPGLERPTDAPAADPSRSSGPTEPAPPAEKSSPGGPITDSPQRAASGPATAKGDPSAQVRPAVTTATESVSPKSDQAEATSARSDTAASGRVETDSAKAETKAETKPAETAPAAGKAETAPTAGKAETTLAAGKAETAPAAGKAEAAPAEADGANGAPAAAERAAGATAAAGSAEETAAGELAAAAAAGATALAARETAAAEDAGERAAAETAEPTAESSGPLTTGKVGPTKPAVGARAGAHGSKSARKKGRTARNAPKPPSAGVAEPATAKAEAAEPTTAPAEAAEPTTAPAEAAEPTTTKADAAVPTASAEAAQPTMASADAHPTSTSLEAAQPTMASAETAQPTTASAEAAEPTTAEPADAPAIGEHQTPAGQAATTDKPQQTAGADARSAAANANVVELLQKADAPARKRVAAAAPGRKVATAAVDTPGGPSGTDASAGTAVINGPAARTGPADKFAAPSRPAWQPMTVPPREELQRGITIFGTTLTRRQTTIGAAILLVLLLLLVFLVPRAFGDGGDQNAATGGDPTVAPTGSAASTGQASSAPAVPPPAASSAPATSAAPSSAPPKTSAAAVPAGWYLYTDKSGFSVPLPDGVRPTGSTSELHFRWNNRLLILAQTDRPQPDPYKDWQQQERNRAGGQYRNYRKIRLERVDYFQSAADWEFTYTTGNGNEQHAVKRNFLTSDTQAYSINWYTTPGDWNAAKKDLQVIYQGFKPRK